jgi:predicted PurR-regulated permease PerM
MESSQPQVVPEISPPWNRTGRIVGALVLLLIIVAAFMYIRPIGSTIVMALLLVAVMRRLVDAVARFTHLRYGLALAVSYLALVIVLVLSFLWVVPWLAGLGGQLAGLLQPSESDLKQALGGLASALGQEQPLILIAKVIRSMASAVLPSLLNAVQVVGFGTFLSFLMLIDLGDGGHRGLNHLPAAFRPDARRVGEEMGAAWVGWLKAMVVFDLVVAGVSAVMFLVLGVPYPWLMTLVSAVVVLIPAFGAIMASLIIAVPCLLLGSTVLTGMPGWAFALLIIILYNIVVNGIYYALLLPMLGKKTELPISVVLIGVLASFSLGSIWVAFILVPLVATVRIVFTYVLAKTREVDPFPPEALAGKDEPARGPAASNKAPQAA